MPGVALYHWEPNANSGKPMLALMEKGEFGPALQSLLDGNRIYNSDTRLLNALGYCYYKTGRRKEALDVLAASLRLNAEQAEVKALVATIEKELK